MSEKKIDLKKVLSVSGHSSLFAFVGKTKNGIVAENINDKKRTAFGESAKVSALSDISVFTDKEELTLATVIEKIKEKENGNAINIEVKKADPEILKKYFEEILPDYDRDRLYVSHMKKILDWYNQLQSNDMLDFEKDETAEDENIKDAE
ncbi:MAG: DUF5606 domain-containing protein [Prevotellaceae bacterium]|jgi:hypothetical protein|nr:DUF5606 domain-containing protein [Prevotellaceae bacterium]